MADLLIQRHLVETVLGRCRLLRLMRAGWLTHARNAPRPGLFSTRDIQRALARMERQRPPPDKIKIAEVRASELRTGRAYVPHPKPPRPDPLDLVINWDDVQMQ